MTEHADEPLTDLQIAIHALTQLLDAIEPEVAWDVAHGLDDPTGSVLDRKAAKLLRVVVGGPHGRPR